MRTQRTKIVDGRARKVSGFDKPRDEWKERIVQDLYDGVIGGLSLARRFALAPGLTLRRVLGSSPPCR